MKRVLILTTMTSPSGAPMAALRLGAGLAERGWPVKAAFLYERHALPSPAIAYEALLGKSKPGKLDYLRIAWRTLQLIRREKPDVLIGFLPLASVLGAGAARLCGVPMRIVNHRVRPDDYGRVMRKLDLGAARAGLYTDVVAVSGGVREALGDYPAWLKSRTSVIYNGLRGWTPSPLDKAEARQSLSLPVHGPLVVSAGRLEPQKNFPLLIQALVDAPGVFLAIAGEGGERPGIERQIAQLGLGDRVKLLGQVGKDEVRRLLAAADMFAQPSLYEGQSNALLEALQAGLPCLVGDVSEQVETVVGEDGQAAGRVLPLDQPLAWGQAMLDLSQDGPALASARLAAARQAQRFSFERMMAAYEALLGRA